MMSMRFRCSAKLPQLTKMRENKQAKKQRKSVQKEEKLFKTATKDGDHLAAFNQVLTLFLLPFESGCG